LQQYTPGGKGETEDDSAPKSAVEEPLSTPEMDAREVEELADSMIRNSPLPDPERSDERLPEGGGSDKLLDEGGNEKLPEKGGGEKLPEEGGGKKLPEKTLTSNLIVPCTNKVLPFS